MFTIVKLDATNSTNSYLKEWAKKADVSHGTVVLAKHQESGRGQLGAKWLSDNGKNLTFSILYKFSNLQITDQFYLNCAVSLAIYDALLPIIGKSLTVKWPNDIMSDDKKIGGILIENAVKNGYISQSVIGIGLNVNQIIFSDELPDATSLAIITQKTFDLDSVLDTILQSLEKKLKLLELGQFADLNSAYQNTLYRRNIFSKFNEKNNNFLGKIIGVTIQGKLQIQLESSELREFSLKEVRFVF